MGPPPRSHHHSHHRHCLGGGVLKSLPGNGWLSFGKESPETSQDRQEDQRKIHQKGKDVKEEAYIRRKEVKESHEEEKEREEGEGTEEGNEKEQRGKYSIRRNE